MNPLDKLKIVERHHHRMRWNDVFWNSTEYITSNKTVFATSRRPKLDSLEGINMEEVGSIIRWTCEMFNPAVDRGKPVYMLNLDTLEIIQVVVQHDFGTGTEIRDTKKRPDLTPEQLVMLHED